jgi:hypothetical protein
MKKKLTSTKKNSEPSNSYTWINFGTKIVERIGITGFIVVFIASFIMLFATIEQKQELINTWLLFKGDISYPAIIINFVLGILLFIQQVHYSKKNKLFEDRISELAAEKTDLQNKLLGRQ